MKPWQEEWQRFRQMNGKQKLVHLWTYYKFHILVILAALVIIGDFGFRALTKKTPVLYLGEVNIAADADLQNALSTGYLAHTGADPDRQEVFLYTAIYLFKEPTMENQEYVSASEMKLMTATNTQMLDLVLMNREGYDICSANGYLVDLRTVFPAGDPQWAALAACLTENDVLLTDDSTEEYSTVSQKVCNGLDVSRFPIFQQGDYPDGIYLGLITGTPRMEECRNYIAYLSAWQPD